MRIWHLLFLILCVTFAACGSKDGVSWYTADGQVCGQGMPRPGCDFYSNGTRILMFSDPYYSPGAVQGVTTWVSPDGISYDTSCACALS